MKEQHLDARGLICPLPVLRARKALSALSAGDILRVRVTDKTAPKDFRLFCAETGHILKSVRDDGDMIEVVVECRP